MDIETESENFEKEPNWMREMRQEEAAFKKIDSLKVEYKITNKEGADVSESKKLRWLIEENSDDMDNLFDYLNKYGSLHGDSKKYIFADDETIIDDFKYNIKDLAFVLEVKEGFLKQRLLDIGIVPIKDRRTLYLTHGQIDKFLNNLDNELVDRGFINHDDIKQRPSVLLCDLDPQDNLTDNLLSSVCQKANQTKRYLKEEWVLDGFLDKNKFISWHEIACDATRNNEYNIRNSPMKITEHLDFIPSNEATPWYEKIASMNLDIHSETLKQAEDKYFISITDLNPGINSMNETCIRSADMVITPFSPSNYNINTLGKTLTYMRQTYQKSPVVDPVTGFERDTDWVIVPNKVRRGKKLEKDFLKDVINHKVYRHFLSKELIKESAEVEKLARKKLLLHEVPRSMNTLHEDILVWVKETFFNIFFNGKKRAMHHRSRPGEMEEDNNEKHSALTISIASAKGGSGKSFLTQILFSNAILAKASYYSRLFSDKGYELNSETYH